MLPPPRVPDRTRGRVLTRRMQIIRKSARVWESGGTSGLAAHPKRRWVVMVDVIETIRNGRERPSSLGDFLLNPPKLLLKIRNDISFQFLLFAIQFLQFTSQACQLGLEAVDPPFLLTFQDFTFLSCLNRLSFDYFEFLFGLRLLFT